MRIHYDREADAVYIRLGNQKPDGVVEISEGINLYTNVRNSEGRESLPPSTL